MFATGESVLRDFFSAALFCFKGIGMERVSVGLVHVQLFLYLSAAVLFSGGKSKAKFKPNIVPPALYSPS